MPPPGPPDPLWPCNPRTDEQKSGVDWWLETLLMAMLGGISPFVAGAVLWTLARNLPESAYVVVGILAWLAVVALARWRGQR